MKISISYPPLENVAGTPLLSQNRQFQWFSEKTSIYPIVPAYAATMLEQAGHEAIWDDAIAEGKRYSQWLRDIDNIKPDVMLIETKTPVVKRHWKIIDEVKKANPRTKLVLVGDHVTALPEESMLNSKADYVLTGGDYDFLLLNLVEHINGRAALERGIWYRENGKIKNTGIFEANHDLDSLPFIDRDLTGWGLYAYNNGNFNETPGTYTMSGRDCWYGKCSFCSWPTLYPRFRVRKPELSVAELGQLIEHYKVKTVFDDTGCFPAGAWLENFCNEMIEKRYGEKMSLGCNMRFGVLNRSNYRLMRKAGFRKILFGLESGNQNTLNRLNKNMVIGNAVEECRVVSEEQLEPHISVMFGYPWEEKEDVLNTLRIVKKIMINGWAYSLQSSIVIPYPGTRLYDEALEEKWFRVYPKDYERFDMKETILNVPNMTPEEILRICEKAYTLFLEPKYMIRKLAKIRSFSDIKQSVKGVEKVLGHISDFRRK